MKFGILGCPKTVFWKPMTTRDFEEVLLNLEQPLQRCIQIVCPDGLGNIRVHSFRQAALGVAFQSMSCHGDDGDRAHGRAANR